MLLAMGDDPAERDPPSPMNNQFSWLVETHQQSSTYVDGD
jgi:hypothetical protein